MAPLGRCKTNNVAKVKLEDSLPVDFYPLCSCVLIDLYAIRSLIDHTCENHNPISYHAFV